MATFSGFYNSKGRTHVFTLIASALEKSCSDAAQGALYLSDNYVFDVQKCIGLATANVLMVSSSSLPIVVRDAAHHNNEQWVAIAAYNARHD